MEISSEDIAPRPHISLSLSDTPTISSFQVVLPFSNITPTESNPEDRKEKGSDGEAGPDGKYSFA